jgi:cleavage and polyadenylation specificity factor subunit 2
MMAATTVKFTPLAGLDHEAPLCSLLQIDETFVLLDAGWHPDLDPQRLDAVRRYAHVVSAVLVAHSDWSSCGALPYLVARCGLACPIYATTPVCQMGIIAMIEMLCARSASEDFDLFSQADIDAVRALMVPLRYNQHVDLPNGIRLTPNMAGHSLGGAVWAIATEQEKETILYVSKSNYRRERHLRSAVLDPSVLGLRDLPSLLIFDAACALRQDSKRKDLDTAIIVETLATLRRGGSVLIPTDATTRMLEVLKLLVDSWTSVPSLNAYKLCWLSFCSATVQQYAHNMLEWFSDQIADASMKTSRLPYDSASLRICQSLEDLEQCPGPRVILTCWHDLENGYAQELFVRMADNERDAVILVTTPPVNTLGRRVRNLAGQEPASDDAAPVLEFSRRRKIALEGDELEQFLTAQREAEEAEQEAREEDAMDVGQGAGAGSAQDRIVSNNAGAGTGMSVAASRLLSQRDFFTTTGDGSDRAHGFFKETRGQVMFPCVEREVKGDKYGLLIDAAPFQAASIIATAAPGGSAAAVSAGAVGNAGDADHGRLTEGAGRSGLEAPASTAGAGAAVVAASDSRPTKCVVERLRIRVRCNVHFFDLDGLSDGVGLENALRRLLPDRLVRWKAGSFLSAVS